MSDLTQTAISIIQNDGQWNLVKLGVHAAAFGATALVVSRRAHEPESIGLLAFLAVTGMMLTGTIEALTMGPRDDFARIIDVLTSNISTFGVAFAALSFAGHGQVFFKLTTLFWVLSKVYGLSIHNPGALHLAEVGDAAASLLAGVGLAFSLGAKVKGNPLVYFAVLIAPGGWALGSYLYWYPEWYPEWFDLRPWSLPLLKICTLLAYVGTVAATIFVTRRTPTAPAYVTYGAIYMHTR